MSKNSENGWYLLVIIAGLGIVYIGFKISVFLSFNILFAIEALLSIGSSFKPEAIWAIAFAFAGALIGIYKAQERLNLSNVFRFFPIGFGCIGIITLFLLREPIHGQVEEASAEEQSFFDSTTVQKPVIKKKPAYSPKSKASIDQINTEDSTLIHEDVVESQDTSIAYPSEPDSEQTDTSSY